MSGLLRDPWPQHPQQNKGGASLRREVLARQRPHGQDRNRSGTAPKSSYRAQSISRDAGTHEFILDSVAEWANSVSGHAQPSTLSQIACNRWSVGCNNR